MFSKSVSLTFIFLCWPTLLVLLKSILCLLPLVLPLLAFTSTERSRYEERGCHTHLTFEPPAENGGGGMRMNEHPPRIIAF